MKRYHLIPVLLLFGLTVLFSYFFRHDRADRSDAVSVSVAQSPGIRVLSENPVKAVPGDKVAFRIEVENGYLLDEEQDGQIENGVFTAVASVNRTIYLKTRKYCTVSAAAGAGGEASYTGGVVLEGDTAEVRLRPDPQYEVAEIRVDDRSYPVPADDVFRFVVQGDSHVTVRFQGRTLFFSAMSSNLGDITIENAADAYHYGDTVRLKAESAGAHVKFLGWSSGGYISEGGRVISEQAQMSYTLQDDTMLFANFEDERKYRVHYDAGQGTSALTEDDTYSPEEYVNLRVDDGSLKRDGFVLTGYNESPDLSGRRHAPGAMIKMPAQDLTLYAEWMPVTPAEYLRFDETLGNGEFVVNGLSEAGRAANLKEIVIPHHLGGMPIGGIAASAFQGIASLECVVIGPGVSVIANDSFADCPNLKTVYLPETLTALGEAAFRNCPAFDTLRVIASLDRAFDYDYDSALAEKYMRLVTSEGKRMILVGGSGLSFGINSAMIREAFPEYTIVNFSCSAYAGIRPVLDILRAQVREGDVVVYVPEYYSYMYGYDETISILSWQYIESNYDMLEDISIRNNPVLFSMYGMYLQEKRAILPDKKRDPNPIYARANFNQAGDIVYPRTNRMGAELYLPDEGALTTEGLARYNELSRELAARGARCFFSFPALPNGDMTREQLKERTDPFLAKLRPMLDASCITLISDPCDYGFAPVLFFDNEYHLTEEGAVERTSRLIDDLRRVME